MMKQRESNFDLLRVIAGFAVVQSHVSGAFVETAVWDYWDGLPMNHPLFSCVYTAVVRFSVPVFLMLTGAFLLERAETADWKKFYENSWKKVFAPAAMIFLFAVVYNLIFLILVDHQPLTAVLEPLLAGAPFYHLWYIPVIAVIYLLMPFVMLTKNALGEERFFQASAGFLFLAMAALWCNPPVTTHWNIGEGFCYLGYVLIGYTIRQNTHEKKYGLPLVALGFLLQVAAGYLLYKALITGADRALAEHRYIVSYAPLTVIGSVMIFAGFCRLTVKKDFSFLSAHTYGIYLVHAFILDLLLRVFRAHFGQRWLTHLDARIFIPLLALLVWAVSFGVCSALKKIRRRA